ncbi:major capsid protein [Streptomyces varsoviensis]|uniref:major capsid protein n=1 Tax=Streptomyces varsoviensis TaxID=67373 RepID=UPI0033F01977
MQLIDEYATPAELTGYARAALRDYQVNQFTLAQFLPNATVNDLSYRFTQGGGDLVEAAMYRDYDAESDIGTREGGVRVHGELPPISRKMPLGEYDRIKMRNLDRQSEELRSALELDSVKLARGIEARVELARGQALFAAKVVIDENGVKGIVDFGRKAGNSVTASATWDSPDAKVLNDFLAWRKYYNTLNGFLPGRMILSLDIMTYLQMNAQIRQAAFPGAPANSLPPLLNEDQVTAVFRANRLPEPVVYDGQVSVAGKATRVTPANQLLLLPPPVNKVGETLWGVPVEANDPRYGLAAEGAGAGVAVGAYHSEDPQTLWTRATAIALPVIGNPDLTMNATVLPAS